MDGVSLDDILNGTDPGDEAPEVTETVEQPETVEAQDAGQPRDEHGRFAPKGDKDPEDPEQSAAPAPETAPQAQPTLEHPALLGERRRRQEAEQERDQLRQQMAQFQQPVQQPQAPQMQGPPDRWEDPEGYDHWLVEQATIRAQGAAMQAVQYQRIQTAAAQFKADKPDYDEAIQTFGQLVQQYPVLIQQMAQSANPAEFAYQTAKTQQEIQQYGSVEALVAARVEAEKQKLLANPPSSIPSAPPTLAAERNAGSRSGPAWSGPTSIEDILGR